MESEVNGNNCPPALNKNKAVVATSSSVEDLSEYTDADESISAPTEILAEFLSAVMLKDYENALKYCKMILQYEPNHATAKEFYPLILEKIIQASAEAETTNGNHTNEPTTDSTSDSEEAAEEEEEDEDDEEDDSEETSESSSESMEDEEGEKPPSDSDGTTASYSSLEDEEADSIQMNTVSTQPNDNEYQSNGNKELNNSDSESPTEPVSQMLVQQLRSLILPDK
ncbi:glutamate-rich protein 2 [Nilaparvata lugens]|uniref:glutamate-rich protein 2 n=1 Tax=Nilaparvata lugens TaxID=108931 RepID=UPI00193D61F8|nr:glutamate-rich protein 2 [Nilaparvata lugens]